MNVTGFLEILSWELLGSSKYLPESVWMPGLGYQLTVAFLTTGTHPGCARCHKASSQIPLVSDSLWLHKGTKQ